jgi:hypothetical protein
MYLLLIFQLAVGMAWPLAEAGMPARQPVPMNHVEHCQGDHGQTDQGKAQQQQPRKHDCCRSMGCQCLCAYTPAIADQSDLCGPIESTLLVPAVETPITTARLDELFRPPIA